MLMQLLASNGKRLVCSSSNRYRLMLSNEEINGGEKKEEH